MPCGFYGSGLSIAHHVLELGKDLFDGIEIRAAGRQEDEMGAFGPDGLACRLAFVGAQIVEDDDIPLGQGRGEHLLDIGGEEIAIDGSIDHPGRIDPVMAQCGDESEGLPMSERSKGLEPLAPGPPTPEWSHVGLDPCLVDEHQPFGINPALMGLPADALAGDVRPILLHWQDRFF